mmetsp:Transcript_30106/g.60220  ORF Transcript_30106/g.60220 Transcript_30106/m.60220 type:complete len:466 (+) Transcript_30106:72-1469(+)|eukprot:CAMPEP_0171334034 /NCGR_PEP_ID=MMETSP0878-20121228/4399_1 /TAXON_ID=67004 /ORGANISM="Thalassiosira weissflogii, Strain CCMP1336" /LENGTH=465 /DNA_ID=CAMNT_0011835067 /DNA_START=78 /DNA_END=1475 /DNA_ORIENTATION=-
MGILKVLRRKRAAHQQSSSDDQDTSVQIPAALSPVNAAAFQDEEIDKENEKPIETILLSPRASNSDGVASSVFITSEYSSDHAPRPDKAPPTDERDDSNLPLKASISAPVNLECDCKRDEADQRGIESMTMPLQDERTPRHSNSDHAKKHPDTHSFLPASSVDEIESFTSIERDNDEESLDLTPSLGEITEVSDDNMLRDDEGNPIDPDEAEENMLRDDEGNIIDPKTLVVKDYLLDLSCESDEYYDDSGEKIDPKELISCVDEHAPPPRVVTDDSTQSEGDAENEDGDDDLNDHLRLLPLHNTGTNAAILPASNQEEAKSSPPRVVTQAYEDLESRGRRNTSSRRHKKRGHRRTSSTGSDEFVHIMFHNRLTTLDEESLETISSNSVCSHDSGDEADDESPRHRYKNRERSTGSFDEKFIKARWEYSLQMMSCGNRTTLRDSGALINDMMVPAESIDLEETGEI